MLVIVPVIDGSSVVRQEMALVRKQRRYAHWSVLEGEMMQTAPDRRNGVSKARGSRPPPERTEHRNATCTIAIEQIAWDGR
jgi:hypothetical protein